ncbi:MAG: hypoxia up-regulated protein 1 [Amphiamblys sp. WSBS2006]|nr:MAG: hypoxia up-regulated protein 1 [Amphiamblys sp. WSBS2006]
MKCFRVFLLASVCVAKKIYLGVDFGTETLKVAEMHTGKRSIDIFLDEQSSRETDAVFGFEGDVPFFGFKARTMQKKTPKCVYPSVFSLLGQKYNSEEVREYMRRYPSARVVPHEARGTVCVQTEDGKTVAIEEVFGYILSELKREVEARIGGEIVSTSATVPKDTPPMRRVALIEAARLSGLPRFELLNNITAVGLGYVPELPMQPVEKSILVCDTGADHCEAGIVSYCAEGEKGDNLRVSVAGTCSGKFSGGDVDKALMDIVFEETERRERRIPEKNIRSLRIEIEKAKKVLCFNRTVAIHLEDIVEGDGFDVAVTREELKSRVEEGIRETVDVIQQTLRKAGKTKEEITEVFLIGGNSRLVALREEIEKVFGKEKLAKKINDKETEVFGAVLYSLYKEGVSMKKRITLEEVAGEEIVLRCPNMAIPICLQHENIFQRDKGIFVPIQEDFELGLYFGGSERRLLSCRISGFPERKASQDAKTELYFRISNGGLVSVNNAVIETEVQEEVLEVKQGGEKPGEKKQGEAKPEEGKPEEEKPGEGKPGEGKPEEEKPGEEKPGEGNPGEGKPEEVKQGESQTPKTKKIRHVLKIILVDELEMGQKERNRLAGNVRNVLDKKKNIMKIGEDRNKLQAIVFEIKNLVASEFVSKEEKEEALKTAEEAEKVIEDTTWNKTKYKTTLESLLKKKDLFGAKEAEWDRREDELSRFLETVSETHKKLDNIKEKASKEKVKETKKAIEEEKTSVLSRVNEAEGQKKHEVPAIKLSEIAAKRNEIEQMFSDLTKLLSQTKAPEEEKTKTFDEKAEL